jgi:hypothetical protein
MLFLQPCGQNTLSRVTQLRGQGLPSAHTDENLDSSLDGKLDAGMKSRQKGCILRQVSRGKQAAV